MHRGTSIAPLNQQTTTNNQRIPTQQPTTTNKE